MPCIPRFETIKISLPQPIHPLSTLIDSSEEADALLVAAHWLVEESDNDGFDEAEFDEFLEL